jgi:hypothetical protein
MATPRPANVPAPTGAAPPAPARTDWPAQVADTIESVIGGLAGKTTVPITTAVRAVVYGIVIGVMVAVALVLLAVAIDRALVVGYRELGVGVWAAHATLGAINVVLGLFLWRKRRSKGDS